MAGKKPGEVRRRRQRCKDVEARMLAFVQWLAQGTSRQRPEAGSYSYFPFRRFGALIRALVVPGWQLLSRRCLAGTGRGVEEAGRWGVQSTLGTASPANCHQRCRNHPSNGGEDGQSFRANPAVEAVMLFVPALTARAAAS